MNKLDFLYQDKFVFVLNKPAEIHSVRNPNSKNISLADLLIQRSPNLKEIGPKPGDAGLVQRLDYETSGVILGACTKEVWHKLHAMILEGKIKKTYYTLLCGKAPNKIDIKNYIGSPYRHAKKVRVYAQKPRGKIRALEAKTCIERIHYFKDLDCSLCLALAPTARRHQIRAHSSFAGYPLLGDSLYGSKMDLAAKISEATPKFLLHAYALEFTHPDNGQN